MLFSEIPFPRLHPVQGGKTTPLHPAEAVRERRKTLFKHTFKNIFYHMFAFFKVEYLCIIFCILCYKTKAP